MPVFCTIKGSKQGLMMKSEFIYNKHGIMFVSIIFYLLLLLFFHYQTKNYAISQATQKIDEVLLNTQALRKYVSIQKNEVYRLQDKGQIDKEYFSPILLSSTYVSKGVNSIYNNLRDQEQKEPITIRFAAQNPRNLDNTATDKEVWLIDQFNSGNLDRFKEIIETDRGKSIYYAVPTRITTTECATCHSDPSLAPKGLVQMYGKSQGFYEHVGEVRALLSTIYPIKNDLKEAKFFFYLLAGATFVVFALIILISYKFINVINSKQKELFNINKNLESKVQEQTQLIVEKNDYLDLILNSSPNSVLVSDLNHLLFANHTFFKELRGFKTVAEFNKKHPVFKDFIYSHLCCENFCNLEKKDLTPVDRDNWLNIFLNSNQKLCFKPEQKIVYYSIITKQIRHNNEDLYLHIIIDITELEEAKIKLEELSIKDELTKLYNRRHFNHIYESEINRAKREGNSISFAIIDIDYFKNYNDSLGHIAGDSVLQTVAAKLKNHFNRSTDYTFRMGGEEFGVLMVGCSKDKCINHTQKFLQEVKSLRIKHPESKVAPYLTVSIGVYHAQLNKDSDIDFYSKADKLLYKAKETRDTLLHN